MMSSSSKRLRINSPRESGSEDEEFCSTSTSDVTALTKSRSEEPSQDCNSSSRDISSVFTHDILPVILDNLGILHPKDLLNFRLVNRCWRDAATSVLLKHSACSIALKIGQVGFSNSDRNKKLPPVFKFYSARPPHSLLPALTQLISTSSEFPSNSITFFPGCEDALRNLPVRLPNPNQNYLLEEDELMRLFSLYGQTIKKLTLSSEISSQNAEKLLFLYLPNVECLDLTNCTRLEGRNQVLNRFFSSKQEAFNKNSNSTLQKLQKIHSGRESAFHCCKLDFLKELLCDSPNLDEVLDVGVGALSVLVNMRRSQLIKSLYYNPTFSHQFASLLDQALNNELRTLKLTELTVKLSQICGKKKGHRDVSRVLNIILRESKDTLEYLEVHVNPKDFIDDIQVPPLGNLKCLKLVQDHSVFGKPLGRVIKAAGSERRSKWGAAAEENVRPVERCVYDVQVFKFENKQIPNHSRIPLGYFPVLSRVILHVDSGSMNTWNQLLAFFALEHTGADGQTIISGDILPSVSTLELTAFPEVDKKLGKLFPNLRHLKIKCEPLSELRNWVWRAFPKLERFYIYDYVPAPDNVAADNFFTGFPQKFCTKFSVDNAVNLVTPELSPEEITCLRSEPYVGECGSEWLLVGML